MKNVKTFDLFATGVVAIVLAVGGVKLYGEIRSVGEADSQKNASLKSYGEKIADMENGTYQSPVPPVATISPVISGSTSVSPSHTTSHTPAPGTAERKIILDAFRKPVQKEVKQAVVFHDVYMRVVNDWAYVDATVRDPAGHTLKYFRGGPPLDFSFTGLLRRDLTGWRVLSWGWGTDTSAEDEAHKRYPKAPKAVFPPDPYAAESAVAPQPKPVTSLSGWTLVKTFSGDINDSNRNTETFAVGPRWKIDWTTEVGQYGDQGTLKVFVKPAPDAKIGDAIGHAVSHGGGGAGSNLQYGAGEYYLSIISSQQYVLHVYTQD